MGGGGFITPVFLKMCHSLHLFGRTILIKLFICKKNVMLILLNICLGKECQINIIIGIRDVNMLCLRRYLHRAQWSCLII
jgi:hypothetical protein